MRDLIGAIVALIITFTVIAIALIVAALPFLAGVALLKFIFG